MPLLNLTPKEIHIVVQALRVAMENDNIEEFAKRKELNALREKLQNVKG